MVIGNRVKILIKKIDFFEKLISRLNVIIKYYFCLVIEFPTYIDPCLNLL